MPATPVNAPSAPFQHVLLPTDFSRPAELALQRALLLPLASSATLSVIHVLPPDLPAAARPAAKADAKRALDELVARHREASEERQLAVTTAVLIGEPFVEIIRRSRKLKAELIVLGKHGRRPFRDLFIGTTAERVVRKGDVPVLVVHRKPARPYRAPVLATDLGDAATRTFDLALRVLGPANQTVHVVHAFNVPFEGFVTPSAAGRNKSEYRRALLEQAKTGLSSLLEDYEDANVQWKMVVRPGDPRLVVLEEAIRRRADLIALGTHARSGVAHALVGSVAEAVIAAAPCDVLVARPVRFSFELP